MMIPYSEQTTAELIALLFREEDRVTLEHIQELAARPDAIEPLRAILRDERIWYEGAHGEWWIKMHAVVTLAAMRAEAALPELIEAFYLFWKSDFDWLHDVLPGAVARFGEAAVEPLRQYITLHRRAHEKDDTYTYARSSAVSALTRLALEHPETRDRVLDFLCDLITDPQENDPTFLGFIVDDPVTLDRERGLAAARIAYDREAVDLSVSGDYHEFVKHLDWRSGKPERVLTCDLFEFYLPEEIAQRQERWKKEEEEKRRAAERRAAGKGAGLSFSRSAQTIPAGFARGADGNLIRKVRIGRNDPCPCLSGMKYKKCCGK
jgi:hypothetical protein